MKLLAKVVGIFDRTIELFAVMGAVAIALIVIGICGEVGIRSIWGQSHIEVVEVSTYLLFFLTFVAAAWVQRREGHVKMDLVLRLLKPRAQGMVNVIISILCAMVFLVITWVGAMVTQESFITQYRLATSVRPLEWPVFIVVPIGSFLLFVQFLRRFHKYLRVFRQSAN